MSSPKFTSRSAARAEGWFSRRHQTDEAHKLAQAERAAHHAVKMSRARVQNQLTEERKAKEKAERDAKTTTTKTTTTKTTTTKPARVKREKKAVA